MRDEASRSDLIWAGATRNATDAAAACARVCVFAELKRENAGFTRVVVATALV
jgi:hypothetical protein